MRVTKKVNSDTATTPEVGTAVNTQPTQPAQSVQPENIDIQTLLARINKLEQENADQRAKSPLVSVQSRNEKYEWPRTYAYKIFRGKPVVNMTTVKQEVYTNQISGRTVIEQIVKVIFGDGTSVEVPLWDFAINFSYSDKLFAKEIIKRGTDTFYVFDTPEGEIEVIEKVLN